jgi:hypothetical protein
MDGDKRFIKFKPKKNHSGDYMIYVTKIFNSTNLNFELNTTVKLTVLERESLYPLRLGHLERESASELKRSPRRVQ